MRFGTNAVRRNFRRRRRRWRLLPGGAGSDAGAAAAALVRAEACYEDAAAAFESARDPVNAALVGLNRAQARRARSTWNLPPTTPEDSNPPGPKPETDALEWRLEEFDAAARLCRGALASLSRLSRGGGGARGVSVPPGVVAAVRVELANALLTEGLLRCERGAHESPGSAASGAAAARMEEAIRTLQVGVAGSPAAAATLATAHYHLGVILADAALAADERGGAGSRSAAGTKAGGLGANPGVSPLAAPQRHLERALAGFPAEDAPLDHVRLRVRLARLAAAAARAAALAGAGAAGGVRHLEVSLSHLLAAAPAFERRPAIPGGGKKADAAWSEARRDVVTALLDALEALVRSSKGGKRHAAHRELFSAALRSLGGKKEARENGGDVDEIDGAGATGARDAMGSPPRRRVTRTRRGWRSRGNFANSTPRRARRASCGEGSVGEDARENGAGRRGFRGWAPYPGGPTDPGQNYVDDRSRLEKWWMKRLVAPCVRSVRLSKALLLVSVHLSAEASTTRAARPKGTGTELAGAGSGARRRSAGSVPVLVPGAPASAVPAPTLPAGTCPSQKPNSRAIF